MVNVYEVRTERLLMRRWRRSDREPLAALNADPEVMGHFPAPLDRVQSDTAVDRYEELFENNGFGLWALERAEDGRFLGFTGPQRDARGRARGGRPGGRLAAGAARLAPGLRHRGRPGGRRGRLRTAAAARVWSMTAVTNTPSQAVMRRLGMHEHGIFDHPRIERGHVLRPHVVYRLDATPRAR